MSLGPSGQSRLMWPSPVHERGTGQQRLNASLGHAQRELTTAVVALGSATVGAVTSLYDRISVSIPPNKLPSVILLIAPPPVCIPDAWSGRLLSLLSDASPHMVSRQANQGVVPVIEDCGLGLVQFPALRSNMRCKRENKPIGIDSRLCGRHPSAVRET